jgi:peptidylamidoglycolate lyase
VHVLTIRREASDTDVVWVLHCPFMSGVYKSAKEYKPSNMAIAPNGDIYVADGYGKTLSAHSAARVRRWTGIRGRKPRRGTTIWPHAIAVDARGPKPLLMVGERAANSRIQYFTMDGKPHMKDGVRWPSIFEFRERPW